MADVCLCLCARAHTRVAVPVLVCVSLCLCVLSICERRAGPASAARLGPTTFTARASTFTFPPACHWREGYGRRHAWRSVPSHSRISLIGKKAVGFFFPFLSLDPIQMIFPDWCPSRASSAPSSLSPRNALHSLVFSHSMHGAPSCNDASPTSNTLPSSRTKKTIPWSNRSLNQISELAGRGFVWWLVGVRAGSLRILVCAFAHRGPGYDVGVLGRVLTLGDDVDD
jgi:hypothetical protein